MSEIWIAGIATAVVGAYGADQQSKAGKRGADAQADASQYATDEQRRQFDITQQNLAPWLQSGTWALGEQRDFLNGDYGAALDSPFYAARKEEGFKGLDAGATAQGNLWGGGMDADRMRLGQNLATEGLLTHYNALAGMSNTGQTTANQLGAYGQNYANQVGQNAMAGAQARASSYANSANAWGTFGNQMTNLFGQYMGQQNIGWGGV